MDQESRKLPYETPRLLKLGDVAELTQSVGNAGASDGGHATNKMKTM